MATRAKATPQPKKGVLSKPGAAPQQANITTVPKKNPETGKPIPDSIDGTMVRLRLFDDRERVLFLKDNASPTAKQVIELMGEKLDLSKDSLGCFSIWIVGKDLELQIRPKMELFEVTSKWFRWMEKYTHASQNSLQYKFVMKREAMLARDVEKQCRDEVAIRLLYGEARGNVLSGRYPVGLADAVALAGLQLQVIYGDFVDAKHGAGTSFLVENMGTLFPAYTIKSQKSSDLEIKSRDEWAKLKGKCLGIAPYKSFLDICYKLPMYGATFFPACKNIPPSGYFELRSDHLYVAVNAECMSIIDDDKHKLSWYGMYEGIEWECTDDSVTIEFMPPKTANQPNPKKLGSTIITPQSHLVDSLASRAIYLIEKKMQGKKKAAVNANQRRASTQVNASGPPGTVRKAGVSVKMASTARASVIPEIVEEAGSVAALDTAGVPSEGATRIPTAAAVKPTPTNTDQPSRRPSLVPPPEEVTPSKAPEEDDPAEYLKQINMLRQGSK